MTRPLYEIQADVHANSVQHGFWDLGKSNIGEKLALIHSEISEALEEYRTPSRDLRAVRYVTDEQGRGKPEGFQIELADAIIRILDLAERLSIDMGWAIEQKVEYNRERPYLHGKAL